MMKAKQSTASTVDASTIHEYLDARKYLKRMEEIGSRKLPKFQRFVLVESSQVSNI